MVKTIYHGSKNIIEKPLYGYGKAYNDYGLGFYCTQSLDMAKEWAASEKEMGFANIYEIECKGLNILDLSEKKYSALNWLAILLENREFDMPSLLAMEAKDYILKHFLLDYQSFDAILGYRADDSYFSFAQDFLNGTISYRQLGNAMALGKLGLQFVLKSERAFERIEFKGFEKAESALWYPKKALRDRKTRRDYFDLERNRRQPGDLYVMQIIDGKVTQNDHRL